MKYLIRATTHLDLESSRDSKSKPERKKSPGKAVAQAEGLEVRTFADLQRAVAELAYYNPEWEIMLRGQAADYRISSVTPEDGSESALFPSLYRRFGRPPKRSFDLTEFQSRLNLVRSSSDTVRLNAEGTNVRGLASLRQHEEARWALLQHYRVCETPLADLTRNARVAASFAIAKGDEATEDAFVYVFAIPYLRGHITHDFAENIRVLNLRSLLPSSALRPHEQEGYLVGSLHSWDTVTEFRGEAGNVNDDHSLVGRLIGKLRIPVEVIAEGGRSFWGQHGGIPTSVLVPEEDPMKGILFEWGLQADQV